MSEMHIKEKEMLINKTNKWIPLLFMQKSESHDVKKWIHLQVLLTIGKGYIWKDSCNKIFKISTEF